MGDVKIKNLHDNWLNKLLQLNLGRNFLNLRVIQYVFLMACIKDEKVKRMFIFT